MVRSTDTPRKNDTTYLKRRRTVAIVSLAVVAALAVWLTVFVSRWIADFGGDPQAFKDFVDGYGWTGWLVALGIQILQVFISLIPGELVEVGLGYAFGAVEGTVLCLVGVAIASTLIFIIVKRFGVRVVELFIPRENIDRLKFINSERKLKRLIFLLFFIPGTPKDLFTYFVGLTRIRLSEFLILSLIARIPSVISSTFGGNLIQAGRYGQAVLLFAITGAVSLLGLWAYNRFSAKRNTRRQQDS